MQKKIVSADPQMIPPKRSLPNSKATAAEPLLRTKLYVPQARPELVTRSRLLERLDQGIQRPLTVISAPPSYGKTTLAVEWLTRHELPFTWLSLDGGDNDPVRFFTYLIAALQNLDPNIGQAAQSLLALPQLPAAEVLATSLINDLSATSSQDTCRQDSEPEPGFALVLDDYHTIHTPFIHAAVEFLVCHAPHQLHLLIVTREDPPLSLARLRVRGQLTEIRADDLRFTSEEAAEWLNRRMGLNLSDSAVGTLQSRTEGWIAGLQLAAISLQGQDTEQKKNFIQAFGGSNRYVIDYLLDEVLRRQNDNIRRFLGQTAILDRLNASLCDAVTERADSKSIIGQLERANLFFIPLDGRREWYRYHHLFAEFLRAELDAADQGALHQKASQWYEANGLPSEAIEHALAGRDVETATRLIEQAGSGLLQSGEFGTLARWLEALPEAAIRQSINLTAYRAWTLYFTGQIAQAAAWATEPATLALEADAIGRGRLVALRASLAVRGEEWSAGAEFGRQALDLIGDADPFFRIMVLEALAEAERHSGHAEAATRLFREGYELGEKLGHAFAALIALTGLVPNLNRQGRRREALAYCHRVLEQNVNARGQPIPIAGLLNVPLGLLYYMANELELAHEHVLQGLSLYKELRLERITVGDGEWTLVQILCARGELDAALALARETYRVATNSEHTRIASLMASVVADVQLKMGDVASAAHWAEKAQPSLPIPPDPSFEFAYFVLARVLLAQSRVEEALLLLGNLNQSAQRDGRYGRLITIYILQALAHHALGNQDVAIDRLDSAVQLAAPEEYRRAFLDEGPIVAELLPHVRHSAPAFVDGLLSAFANKGRKTDAETRRRGDSDGETRGRGDTERTSQLTASLSPPIIVSSFLEPLSERELEVLRLLASGKSNAEIAQALVVTVGTAKWHVHHVLAKLGANNRTQAVTRARELDLL